MHQITTPILDAFGRTLMTDITQDSDRIIVEVSALSAGVYWLRLSADGEGFSAHLCGGSRGM